MSGSRGSIWRAGLVAWVVVPLVVSAGSAPAGAAARRPDPSWVAAWAASPVESTRPGLVDATERMVVRVEFPGDQVRIRLSNAMGTRPVTVNDAFVGRSGGGAAVAAGTNRVVTFDGRSSVTIAARSEVWSDPVHLTLAAEQSAVISLFAEHAPIVTRLDDSTGVPSFRASGGDHAGDRSGSAFGAGQGWLVADGVAVVGSRGAGVVVALGNSITAGYQHQPTPNLSWPSVLAARLQGGAPDCRMSVVNAGIGGNQLTAGAETGGFGGPSTLERADRDAFSQPGARVVIVLVGINDIGAGGARLAQLISGYRQLIAAAHARHLRIVAGTLTPAGDPAAPPPYPESYAGPAQVRERLAVNRWIRTSHAFDGVVDFADALASPRDPNQLLAAYDSGDHLHPSDAGYRQMASTVDLSLLRRCPA